MEPALLRAVVDRVPAMLAYWDSELRCRFANRAYERWFGVSPETLLGKHISELLGPLYRLNLPYIEAALRGEPQEFEREIPDPAGGPSRHSLANYIPDVADGVVRGFYVLVSDISEIKRTQLALREAEERFRLTIDEAPIGMALVAPDGRFVRVNRALCELVGYTADELTGLTFHAITHPDDLDIDLALAQQLERGDIPRYKLGKRYVRKDGTVVDVMLSGSALRGPDGRLLHFIAQIEDVTEQRRAEVEQRFLARLGPVLASSLDYEETLRRIAEAAVEEIVDLCVVTSIEDGDEMRRIKVAVHDPKKAWLCDALASVPIDRSRSEVLRTVLATRKPVVVQRPSARDIAALAHDEAHARILEAAEIEWIIIVPLVDGEQLLGTIGLISMSPERVYSAADLRLAEELARRAALSVRSARLYRAEQRATQARDDVLGIVAHDLRNPLNNVLLQATVVQETLDHPARAARAADAIERSAHRMNRLIQDLLDVARIEAGKLSVAIERVSITEILRDAINAQHALVAAAGLRLESALPARMPHVLADRDRVYQILENLIGNAIKFTDESGSITVRAAVRDGEVEICVADTGSGISAEQLPHLFDRFWQARQGTRTGAGLGLAIVQALVQAHRGRIWVDSAPNLGTRIHFTIPTAPPAARARGAKARSPGSRARVRGAG